MANDLLDNSMNETELGLLPSDWKLLPFGDVIEFESGQVDPRQEPYSSMLHVGPENIAEGSGKLLECTSASTLNLISGKYLFSPMDVLYSKIRPYLRKVPLPDFNGVCSADMYPLRPSGKALTREYLYCWLLSDTFTRQSVSHQGRTGIPKINRQQLQSTWVVCPPLAEQQAIAYVLRTVQRAKEATEKVIAAARQLKQSLMRHLFAYGPVPVEQADKVPLKETEIGPIPKHWERRQFGEYVNITSGQVDPRKMPYLKMLHVGPENIEEATGRIINPIAAEQLGLISGKYLFGPKDVLYSKIRPYLRKVALPDFDGVCSADMYPLQPKQGLRREYLYCWLLSEAFTRQAVSHQGRTGIPKINRQQLDSTLMPRPPETEQNHISDWLLKCDLKARTEEKRRNALDMLFRTLLHHLMTGKVRVNELEFPAMKEGRP